MNNIENNNIENNANDTKDKLKILKQEVYKSISNEFNITPKSAKELSNFKSEIIVDIKNLKQEIENNIKIEANDKSKILSLTNDRLHDLINIIKWSNKLSENEILDWLEVIKIWDKKSLTKKIFPKFYEKYVNAESKTEQVIWFCLWTMDSCSTTIKFLLDIWSWVIKTPTHTYLIISWKWQYNNISKWSFILAFIVTIFSLAYIVINLID